MHPALAVNFEPHPVPETDYAGWLAAWYRTIATNLIGPANLSFLVAGRDHDGTRRGARGQRILYPHMTGAILDVNGASYLRS